MDIIESKWSLLVKFSYYGLCIEILWIFGVDRLLCWFVQGRFQVFRGLRVEEDQ